MSIAADDGERLGKDRPWAKYQDEEKDGAYADYGAWERWLVAIDPDNRELFDALPDHLQVDLYVLMARLADGDAKWPTHEERMAEIRRGLDRDREIRESCR